MEKRRLRATGERGQRANELQGAPVWLGSVWGELHTPPRRRRYRHSIPASGAGEAARSDSCPRMGGVGAYALANARNGGKAHESRRARAAVVRRCQLRCRANATGPILLNPLQPLILAVWTGGRPRSL